MSAKEVLELIENVDPEDDKALSNIDANVYVFLKLYKGFKVTISGTSVHYRHEDWDDDCHTVLYHLFDHHRYTRSLDAIVAIQPEGWMSRSNEYQENKTFKTKHGFEARLIKGTDICVISKSILPTEPLSRLHAAIQAIEWERENEKRS